MKNFLTFWFLITIMTGTDLFGLMFNVAVPEALVQQQATLLVYMVDQNDNQVIGKFQLNEKCRVEAIQHQELVWTSCDDASLMQTGIDLLTESNVDQNSVVISFDLDSEVRIVHVLVVKEYFFDEDPIFGIVSVPFDSMNFDTVSDEPEDALEMLANSIDQDSAAMQAMHRSYHHVWFDQYMLYAKIFVMMQYNKAQRLVRSVKSWLL
ncbi:hypothetical protein KBD08_03645 [Candidatus Babeliales bacterium]|nr:hypothetical protein [Candidatus Babeliales bacterium]